MKTARKVLLLALCAALLVSATVMGTLAYLTSTDEVTNTFSVGNVKITLDEAKVGDDGKAITGEGAERVQSNSYKLLPGHEYDKDPTVHVDAASEDCYIFVKVENEIAAIEADTKIAAQMATNGWTAVEGVANLYCKTDAVKGGTDHVVFSTVKVADTVDNATLATYKDKTVKVTAYAIQKDGFTTAKAAWDAAGADLTNP